MISYNNKNFFRILLQLKGTVYRAILGRCLFAALVSFAHHKAALINFNLYLRQIGLLASILEHEGYIDAEGSMFPPNTFRTFYTFVV